MNKQDFNSSYNSNNPNVNVLTDSSFASIKPNDIRVSYVDAQNGLISDVTIADANVYAQQHPGTTFIFKNGFNQLEYLNINQVNNLTLENLASSNSCPGFQSVQSCNVPPTIQFVGGEGLGAIANPIIGNDGSLLAVDLIDGGYGYHYAPQVQVKDVCNIGSGAVVKAEIGNTVQIRNICDYTVDEEYQIPLSSISTYEKVYDADGQELGYWDPTSYTDIRQSNVVQEINTTKINSDKITNPFWTSRSTIPTITDTLSLKSYSTEYDVTFETWNDFMNTYGISPVSPSSLPSTDGSGRIFILEWNVEFPYDGEYVFRGLCEKIGKFYLNDSYLFDLKNSTDLISPYVKTIRAGTHRIRVDLKNYYGNQIQSSFNTLDFIQKANQQLQRISSTSNLKSSFLYEYGISPIIDQSTYNGTYKIRWNNINLSSDGNYILQFSANCNIKIQIGNVITSAEKLQDRSQVYYFSSGNYDIEIELEKIDFSSLDPVALGINLFYSPSAGSEISALSWTQNPMGVSLSIDAPSAPNTKSSFASQNVTSNVIWTTRFTNSTNSWYSAIYNQNETWSGFMNLYAISPILVSDNISSNSYSNSWIIDAPHTGFYGLRAIGSDTGRILIDNEEVKILDGADSRNPSLQKIYLSQGTHQISIELNSKITQQSWQEHPIGVSATLVYCQKQVQGTGTITKIVVLDSGNGYYSPGSSGESPNSISSLGSNGYPVILQLDEILINDGGLRYNSNEDQIQVIPDNGAELTFTTDDFGIVNRVTVKNPGAGFTEYPRILIRSKTGINFSATPAFTVIRDPINLAGISTTNILQVTDLVGIKKTGYIDGRPYYGSIYYENGSKYVGPYKTPGAQIPVYETLQESIAGNATIRPSAIQKLGSNINSNNSSLF